MELIIMYETVENMVCVMLSSVVHFHLLAPLFAHICWLLTQLFLFCAQ